MKKKNKFKRLTPLFSERPSYKSIGYARQSINREFPIGAQVDELMNAGCAFVFQETINSSNKERPKLDAALKILQEGDEIVFTKLDRGFRNQREFITTLHDLQEKGIHVRTTDGMINSRALEKFAPTVINLLFGFLNVERQMAIERTQESITYRKETGGNLGGRPKTNMEKEALVIRLRNEGCSYRSIRNQTGLALSTIRRIIVEKETVA